MENSELDKRSYLIGYRDGQEEIPSRVKETCKWKYIGYHGFDFTYVYDTSCNKMFSLDERLKLTLDNNKYCLYCGKEIEEIKE